MKHVTLAVMLLILLVCHAVNGSKITLDSKRAKRFFRSTKRGMWPSEWLKSDEDIREECYTKGCLREEVHEKFEKNEPTNEYYGAYRCWKYPGTCSNGPSAQS